MLSSIKQVCFAGFMPNDRASEHFAVKIKKTLLSFSFFREMPSKNQWRQLFKVLDKKEKKIFLACLILVIASLSFLAINFYLKNTKSVPASGGEYIEGVAGYPRFINPVYAITSDVDRDLTEIVYSGLMKHDKEGKIIPDLAKEYKILEDGRIYEFSLEENLSWSDGKPITADDILFTVKTIQNPSFKSPLRINWLGIKVEKISDFTVRFELKNPSAIFMEHATLKIMPQHIWEEITYQNFPLSVYNLKPMGSGPYKIKKISQDRNGNVKSLELSPNQNYSGNKPNISKIKFLFFENEEKLIKAFNSGQIKGFALLSSTKYKEVKQRGSEIHKILLPRYFSVFFNARKSNLLSEKNIRQALNYATDKNGLVNEILPENAIVVDSPVLPEIYNFDKPEKIYGFDENLANELLDKAGFEKKEDGFRYKEFNNAAGFRFKSNLVVGSQGEEVRKLQECLAKYPDIYPDADVSGVFGAKTKTTVIKFQEKYAKEILEPSGLTKGTGDVKQATRTKLNELCLSSDQTSQPLTFTLITVDQPMMIKTAEALKKQWEKIGIKLEIKTFDITYLEEEIIKPRNYEMLLLGEVLGSIPDPFPFWHSSQIIDPGLNLANYENKTADNLLERLRQILDEEKRKQTLQEFQNILIPDAPAVFLYGPNYIYFIDESVRGIDTKIITDPSKRFDALENWYTETKRIWK